MGLESKTTARVGRKRHEGKLHLDSKTLTFTSQEFRWSAALGNSVRAEARKELLIVQDGTEKVSFEIGPAANKWVEKILNPPNRLTKLGVKPEHVIWISKGFAKSFSDELKQHAAKITRQIEKCDLAFWKVIGREQLAELDDLVERLPKGVNFWIVWPKGSPQIGQTDVMQATKNLNFGPSKTAAFDDQLSSMRFARKK